MARPRRPQPPDHQQAARYGIDTLYFSIPKVQTPEEILRFLQTFVDSTLTSEDLKPQPGNGFYSNCLSVSSWTENPKELLVTDDPNDYQGIETELLRVYFDPRAVTGALYSNNTTSCQLKGHLLQHFDYHPLLRWLAENKASVTRLDLFKDDYDHLLNMDLLHKLFSVSSYKDHIQSPLVKTYLDIYNGENSIYLNTKGNKQLHIYNKALEQGEKFRRTRVEIKLRKDNKFQTALVTAMLPEMEESIITGIISKYLQLKPEGSGSIHKRQPYKWWTDFLSSSNPIRVVDFVPRKHKRELTPDEKVEKIKSLEYQVEQLRASLVTFD